MPAAAKCSGSLANAEIASLASLAVSRPVTMLSVSESRRFSAFVLAAAGGGAAVGFSFLSAGFFGSAGVGRALVGSAAGRAAYDGCV